MGTGGHGPAASALNSTMQGGDEQDWLRRKAFCLKRCRIVSLAAVLPSCSVINLVLMRDRCACERSWPQLRQAH